MWEITASASCEHFGSARGHSSFFMPALARSVCVRRVGIGVPGCPRWDSVFIRDLPAFMAPSIGALKRMSKFNASLLSPPKAFKMRYSTMRDALPTTHPCRHASLGECYRSFAAALK